MKLNNTFILVNSGGLAQSSDWAEAHARIVRAITEMVWPPGNEKLRIPRIVTIKAKESYINRRGQTVVARKPIRLRNGVKPLRTLFRTIMQSHGWSCEYALSMAPYFEKTRLARTKLDILHYPSSKLALGLKETVGDFDFWDRTNAGFRTIIEWETGNISSSHRSLNKMCLALMGGVADAAVLIVPSWYLYPHLTDRIGNVRELEPYFYFWSQAGKLVKRGLLAVVEVEHDELFKSTDERDFLTLGAEGNSLKLRRR